MKETAIRADWEHFPISDARPLSLKMQFDACQFLKLTKGFVPCGMDDKWFICFEEGWLYFYRSWTGKGIYKAKVELQENKAYAINTIWVERDKENYENEEDEFDLNVFTYLVTKILLK